MFYLVKIQETHDMCLFTFLVDTLKCLCKFFKKELLIYINVYQTLQEPKYFRHFIDNNNFTTHVGAECRIEYSRIGFKCVAQRAADKLLHQCQNANTVVVYTIVNRRTIYYVAKCKRNKICSIANRIINMKAWPCPYPNAVGTECQIRGRVSGYDANFFLRMIGRYDLHDYIILRKKPKDCDHIVGSGARSQAKKI